MGIAGGHLGVGVGVNTSRTALSRSTAPPKMPGHQKAELIVGGVLILLTSLVILFSAGAIVPFWMFLVAGIVSLLWSQAEHVANWDRDAEALHKEYARTFMCHVCGHRFVPRRF